MNAGLRFSAMASWNAVVDVSNVCWSPHLPPLGRQAPAWDRLGLVMAAWREQHGADTRLELVADDSLVRVLGPDARAFLELKRGGGIRTASVADDEILRLAHEGGLYVITRDHYIDHRAAHRWIDQSPERFQAWETIDGVVRLAPLGIRTRSAQDVSQAREVKVLREALDLRAFLGPLAECLEDEARLIELGRDFLRDELQRGVRLLGGLKNRFGRHDPYQVRVNPTTRSRAEAGRSHRRRAVRRTAAPGIRR